MLIDINLAKKFFSEYVKKYDYKDKQVKLKIAHIERVSQMVKKLANDCKKYNVTFCFIETGNYFLKDNKM